MKEDMFDARKICNEESSCIVVDERSDFRSGYRKPVMTPLGEGICGSMGHGPGATMLIVHPAEAVIKVYVGSNPALTGCLWTVEAGATVWIY